MSVEWKTLSPLNSQILVRDDKKADKFGEIYLPGTVGEDKMIEGEVLGISDILLEDGTYISPLVKVGMKVAYNNFAGAGNQWDEEERTYRLIKFNEILAIVKR